MKFLRFRSIFLVSLVIVANLILVLFMFSTFYSVTKDISANEFTDTTSIEPNNIDDLLDADGLTMYHFFRGIDNGDSLKYWRISTVTHFFPIIPLYAISFYTTKNPGLANLIYILIQLLLILLLFSWLTKQIVSTSILETRVIGISLLSLFIIYPFYGPEINVFYSYVMPYHSGMFISVLLSLIFLFKSFKNGKLYLPLLFVSNVLAVISNPLFHIYFTIPILCVLTICAIRNLKKIWPSIATVVTSVITGIYLLKILPDIADSLIHSPEHYESFIIELNSLVNAFKSSFLMGAILITSTASFIYSAVVTTFAFRKKIFAKEISLSIYEIYHMYTAITISISLIAPIIAGNYYSFGRIRYVIYSFIMGIFNLAVIAAHHSQPSNTRQFRYTMFGTLAIFGIFIGSMWISYNPFDAFSRLKKYNDPLAEAVDSLSRQYHLKNGIADFWSAKPVTIFSKENIKVIHTYTDMNIWFHSCNLLDCRFDSINKLAYYNFIILRDWEDKTQIHKTFGDSIVEVSIDNFQFYLVPEFFYNDNFQFERTGRFDFSDELEFQNKHNRIQVKNTNEL